MIKKPEKPKQREYDRERMIGYLIGSTEMYDKWQAYHEQELARAEGLSRDKIERAVCKATGWLKHEMRTEDYEFTKRIADAIIAATARGEK